jgi:hypothetical protein
MESGLWVVMALLRTMKEDSTCFVQSGSGLVVSRIGTKNESRSKNSTLIKGHLALQNWVSFW